MYHQAQKHISCDLIMKCLFHEVFAWCLVWCNISSGVPDSVCSKLDLWLNWPVRRRHSDWSAVTSNTGQPDVASRPEEGPADAAGRSSDVARYASCVWRIKIWKDALNSLSMLPRDAPRGGRYDDIRWWRIRTCWLSAKAERSYDRL